MKITKLELHLNKRIRFNRIDTIVYRPQEIHQIILGVNGSGKSSLINELSPLPANSTDYLKGGYKLVEIEHRGSDYKLLNDFSSKGGGKHSFIKDGEELNSGGTLLVQKQLVAEYFGLDNELFDILLNHVSFREMSPANRRRLLLRMADDNMGGVLQIYNKAKNELRDKQAVAKHLSSSLVDLNIVNKEFDENSKRILTAKSKSDELIKSLQNILFKIPTPKSESTLEQIKQRIDTITGLTNECFKLPIPDLVVNSNSNIHVLKAGTEAYIKVTNARLKELISEIDKTRDIIEALTKEGAYNLTDLENKLLMLQEHKVVELAKLITYTSLPSGVDVGYINNKTNTVKAWLGDILDELEDNSDAKYNRDNYHKSKDEKEKLIKQKGGLLHNLARLQHLAKHFDNDNKTQCPICHGSFYIGVGNTTKEEVDRDLSQVGIEIDKLDEQIDKVDEYLRSCLSYFGVYKRLTVLMEETSELEMMWKHVRDIDLSKEHPNNIRDVFNVWQKDIDTWIDIKRIDDNISDVISAISKLKEKNGEDMSSGNDKLKELIRESDKLTNALVLANSALMVYADYERISKEVDHLDKTVNNHLAYLDRAVEDYELSTIIDAVKKELTIATLYNNNLAEDYARIVHNRDKMLDLHEQHRQVSKEVEELKILVDELSPTNGLIADYSLSFVKQFTDQMNTIINSIWTYDMQIKPSPVEEDLTYKFPLYMAESDTQTPDINRASTGQKKVIDFAFTILLMSYLGLEDYPLYLDEVSSNMDEAHRIRIMNFIRDYVESGKCSQMFLISHDQEASRYFPRADTIMLHHKDHAVCMPIGCNKTMDVVYENVYKSN